MQVANRCLSEALYQNIRHSYNGKLSSTTFEQIVRSAREDGGHFLSPAAQLWDDYGHWKAAQPPRNIPGSRGATEENLAYLRENFSGELSLFQKVDALDTMVDMGILTRREMLEAVGLGPVTLEAAGKVGVKANGTPEEAREDCVSQWSSYYTSASIVQTGSLEDLFKLLDKQLKNSEEKDAAQEIRDVLEQVARKSFGAGLAMLYS